jgi:hypothetical protein
VYQLKRVETVQNACSKFLTGAERFDSVTEQLKKPHWQFKQCLYAHGIGHNNSHTPNYFSNAVTINVPTRLTRSASSIILVGGHRPKIRTIGCRSLSHTFPDLWNSLPYLIPIYDFVEEQ